MDWNAPTSDAAPGAASAPASRSPYLAAVRAAWRDALEAQDPRAQALGLALCLFARDGHARGLPVATLLHALDGLVRPARGGDRSELAAVEQLRAWAGTQVIRAYYGAD